MTPLSRIGSIILVFVVALPIPAAESDDLLNLIPPNATAVVQNTGLEGVQQRLDAFLTVAVPDKEVPASNAVR